MPSKSFERTRACRFDLQDSIVPGACRVYRISSWRRVVEKGNATALHFRFLPKSLADLASIARDDPTMRTVAVIFALALITIAFEIYSDVVLTRSEFSRPAPDPATTAVAHALNADRRQSRP